LRLEFDFAGPDRGDAVAIEVVADPIALRRLAVDADRGGACPWQPFSGSN